MNGIFAGSVIVFVLSLGAIFLLFYLIRHGAATKVASLMYLVPPCTAVLAWLLFGETLGNPGLDVLDIPAVSAIAHEAGVPLLVDSTFTTPWLMKPLDLGADLVAVSVIDPGSLRLPGGRTSSPGRSRRRSPRR